MISSLTIHISPDCIFWWLEAGKDKIHGIHEGMTLILDVLYCGQHGQQGEWKVSIMTKFVLHHHIR